MKKNMFHFKAHKHIENIKHPTVNLIQYLLVVIEVKHANIS